MQSDVPGLACNNLCPESVVSSPEMIFVDASHPANRPVLTSLETSARADRPLMPAAEAIDPYYEAGCHPEVVGWMWERLSKKLPPESRCLVYGTPCIVHPASGILLAVGMGTSYVIRLLTEFLPAAAEMGCTPRHTWGDGRVTDLSLEYGAGWVFGSYSRESVEWCRATFHHFSAPPTTGSVVLTAATPAKVEAIPRGLILMVGTEPGLQARVHTVNPDAQQIETIVHGLDWSSLKVVILRAAEHRFLELSGSLEPGEGLSGRYVDGAEEMITREAPSLEVGVQLLQAYATGDSSWKTLVEWD